MKLENFSERMSRILLMAPLYQLGKRRLPQANSSTVSCMELGLMTLLFFFETMLDGKKKAGIRDLAAFLQEQTASSLFSDFAAYEKLARDIIAVFRPPTGKRNEEHFYDWVNHIPASVQYSYLKADKANLSSNEQYYVLDEQGLELIFATKEYFNEYQLSINQLILRKQLEKGQFVLALRQVEEMRLDVETLRNRMHHIQQEIHRSIVSEETLQRYRKIVKSFINETKKRIHDNVDKDPERRAYENILDVERRLDAVHAAHRGLLQLGIDLGTSALTAAEEALYFSGIDSFNFNDEITNRMFASPLPLTASRRVIEPFLPLEQCTVWSPLAVFFPQRLERLERENTQEEFPDWEEKEWNEKILHNIQQHYAAITADLLAHLQQKRTTTLKAFLSYEETHHPSLCHNRQFYIFWMLLHRKGTLLLTSDQLTPNSIYAGILTISPSLQEISVTECSGILQFATYTISNMTIKVVTHS